MSQLTSFRCWLLWVLTSKAKENSSRNPLWYAIYQWALSTWPLCHNPAYSFSPLDNYSCSHSLYLVPMWPSDTLHPHCIPTILLGISTVISNLPCSLMDQSHSLQICPALSGPHLAKVRDSKVPAPFSPPSDPVNTECKWFIAKPKHILPTAPFPPRPHPFSASCCNSLLTGLFPVSPLSPTAFVDDTADLI